VRPRLSQWSETIGIPPASQIFLIMADGAGGLRNQAAACRRLAARALTAGTSSMQMLADHFEDLARNLELAQPTNAVEEAVDAPRLDGERIRVPGW